MKNNQKWNTKLYDKKHKFVSQYGTNLIHLLDPVEDEYILDLGCGTGDLANKIQGFNCNVIGIDASLDMINTAKEKYPHMDFHHMPAEDISLNQSFHAVFSNAVLHWVKEPKVVLEEVYKALKDGGRLVIEFGGYGNCKRITNAIVKSMEDLGYNYDMNKYPWYFPKVSEFSTLLENTGFTVRLMEHYDRITPLKGNKGMEDWIRMFASNLYRDVDPSLHEQIISMSVDQLKEELYIDDTWYADYKRIRAVAYKNRDGF